MVFATTKKNRHLKTKQAISCQRSLKNSITNHEGCRKILGNTHVVMENNPSSFIIFKTEDEKISVDVRFQDETVWLSQEQMAMLFERDRTVIVKHIANIFSEGELEKKGNVQNLHIANSDKPVKFYNLNVIISVGYRVKSLRGTQFHK